MAGVMYIGTGLMRLKSEIVHGIQATSEFRKGRKRAERTQERKLSKECFQRFEIKGIMGPKCGIFDATYGGTIFKIMLAAEAGSTFLKKDEKMDVAEKWT